VNKILEDIRELAEMPEIGANLQNIVRQKTVYKYILTFKHYTTLYYIEGDEVFITLVMHTSRDLSSLKIIENKLIRLN
jgi:Plasmid stabilisation system protein.